MKIRGTKYKHIPPTEAELAWLCGIWEGEGSWSYKPERRKPNRNGKVYVEKSHLRMNLQMTDEDIMLRVASIMDGRKITYTEGGPVHKAAGQKPSYYLSIGGEPAHFWTKLMLPYLGKRRKEKYFMLCEKLNEHMELVESFK
jgi:hypothetical protein